MLEPKEDMQMKRKGVEIDMKKNKVITIVAAADGADIEKQIKAYEMIASGFKMLESDTESVIESKNKHPHLHLATKNINVHISKSGNVDDMKKFIRKSNR